MKFCLVSSGREGREGRVPYERLFILLLIQDNTSTIKYLLLYNLFHIVCHLSLTIVSTEEGARGFTISSPIDKNIGSDSKK